MGRENVAKRREEEVTIDLLLLFKALWQKAVLIIVISAVVAAVTFIGSKILISPYYHSFFTCYVNNKAESTESLSASDLSASQSLTNTYSELIKSRTVQEKAANLAGIDVKRIGSDITINIKTLSGTQIVKVDVVAEDYQTAYALATALAEIVPDYATEIVAGSSVKLIDPATEITGRYGPNYIKKAVMGFIIAFVAMCCIVVVVELLDTKVKNQETLEEAFGYPVIGAIPEMMAAQKVGSKYGYGYGKKEGND